MKKIALFFSIAVAAISSQASYLWWSVDLQSSNLSDVYNYAVTEKKLTYDQIKVNVMQSTDGTTKTGSSIDSATLVDEYYTGDNSVKLSDIASQSGYSYYIEIVNASSGEKLGYSTTMQTYNQLAEAKAILPDGMTPVTQASVWHGGSSYKATPEPTSAMLMLLGVAGLALRRKQRKLA